MNLRSAILLDSASDVAYESYAKARFQLHELLDSERDVKSNPGTIEWPNVYQWSKCSKWVDSLLVGLSKRFQIERRDLPQTLKGVVQIFLRIQGQRKPIIIDFGDDSFINEQALANCSVYFKMQYSKQGYDDPRIVPGGYVPNSLDVRAYLADVRQLKDGGAELYEVYGRFSARFAKDMRRAALSALQAQQSFHYEGGFKIIRYSRFLKEVAQSKVCISLPGNGDFCFRLIDYMAVGACIVTPPLKSVLQAPLLDRVHLIETKEDLSDLVPICEQLLQDSSARRELVIKSRSYFDKHLSSMKIANYYAEILGRV